MNDFFKKKNPQTKVDIHIRMKALEVLAVLAHDSRKLYKK